jgi:GT2 family glycosyltransferase
VTGLTVVVPTFNRAASLARLLDSLAASSAEVDELEVVVVDDGSTDDTESIVRAAAVAPRYIRQANAGPAVARNSGWQAAGHPHVLFVDDDCTVMPGSLVAATQELEHFDAVGGTIQPRSRQRLLETFTELEGLVNHKVVDGHVRYLVTACLAVRRSALEVVGGFDDRFVHGGEDADLSMTLAERGYRLGVSPRLRVLHDHRVALSHLVRTYYRHGTGQSLLLAKHPTRGRALRGSVHQRTSPLAWLNTYRRYRIAATRMQSAGCVALRATMMVPWLVGAYRGRSLRGAT